MPTDPPDAAPTLPSGQHQLPTAARHSTADTYHRLLDIEVRSLLSRLTELTGSVDRIFEEINSLMLQTEEMLGRIETLSNGLNFSRTEVTELKRVLTQHVRSLAEISSRVAELERRQNLYGQT